jgi:hypothetical protein
LAVSSTAVFVHVDQHAELFQKIPKVLLAPAGRLPAKDTARSLRIPVLEVYRHYEAGVFTLEGKTGVRPVTESVVRAMPFGGAPAFIGDAFARVLRGECIEFLAEESPAQIFAIRPGDGIPLFVVAPQEIDVARAVDAHRAVYGIAAPDLTHLSQPHTIEHIAAECVRALRSFRPSGPYALGGWQADGVVAIEMARQLETEGEEIDFVALFDTDDHLLRRARRIDRLMNWFSRHGGDAVSEGLRHYRAYPWSGRVLRIPSHVAEAVV